MYARIDVVAVGAGPNGLAAALTCARAGLQVVVLEAASTPATLGTLEGDGPANGRIYEPLARRANDLHADALAPLHAPRRRGGFRDVILEHHVEGGAG